MLMAVELNCWPSIETAPFHPPTSSPFKYINTGCYIGWVKAIKSWLRAFDKSLLSGKSDQKAAHELYKKKPFFYALDHWCQIFLCLYKVPADALQIDALNKKIQCNYTNTSPCILHANGKSFDHWDQVYSLFFDKKALALQDQIQKLVETNPYQLSFREYTYLAGEMQRYTPCNVLIFGLGNDSTIWHQINTQGKTIFLEHNQEWYERILSNHPHLNSYFIHYHTVLSDWQHLLHQDETNLSIELPPEVMQTQWDIIFVDAPEGYASTKPGRMQSIYMASVLGQKGLSHVFVHDCDRPVEKACCSRFLADAKLVRSIEKLRHYKFEKK